jgi:hypothetical protein
MGRKGKSNKYEFGRCTLYYETKIKNERALNDLEEAVLKNLEEEGWTFINILFWRRYE